MLINLERSKKRIDYNNPFYRYGKYLLQGVVKNDVLADRGRKRMHLDEKEMQGLMNLRSKGFQVLAGARITGSLHMTIQTAILIETLVALGAKVRWASCNVGSTEDDAAAAIAVSKSANVFAWKGETDAEYWWCLFQTFRWPRNQKTNLIVDDGGDAALMLHRGFEMERYFEETGSYPKVDKQYLGLDQILLAVLKKYSDFWHKTVSGLYGISEETTTGVMRLNQWVEDGKLLVPTINVNDADTKSMFDNFYGCAESIIDGIKRATDRMIAGKTAVVCGYGPVGRGCAHALRAMGANIIVTEINPKWAQMARMDGHRVKTVEDSLQEAHLYVTATGCCDVINLDHMRYMKDNAIVCNIGHFDHEIDMAALYSSDAIKTEIKPGTDLWKFSNGNEIIVLADGRLVNLVCATGHSAYVMSNSFSNQVLAQIRLFKEKLAVDLYDVTLEDDENVADMHLDLINADLTILTEKQERYLGLTKGGPRSKKKGKY